MHPFKALNSAHMPGLRPQWARRDDGLVKLIIFVMLLGATVFTGECLAETLYVDGIAGQDSADGSIQAPLGSLSEAIRRANENTDDGPTTIKVAQGIYPLTESLVIRNKRQYTRERRYVIQAQVLPDEPQWRPDCMPTIISLQTPERSGQTPTESSAVVAKINHVTVRGLRFLGNPLLSNNHIAVERIGDELQDLVVQQCVFIGDPEGCAMYCPVIATGHEFIVDHCIFLNCHASAVFWDGEAGREFGKNAMRYCIVAGGRIAGPWTCRTRDDFEFHHNAVIDCRFFWIRRPGDTIRYTIRDCVIAGNKHYSGSGNAAGPFSRTGGDVSFIEENVIKNGPASLVLDKKRRDYLHLKAGTPGSDLGAGLFTTIFRNPQ